MAPKKPMTEKDLRRAELKAKIIAGCKASNLDESSYPQTWTDSVNEDVAVIKTPSPGLNRALGVGGIPYGRIIEIYGTESSGKTTLTLQLAAEAQRSGRDVAFIDMAQSLDPQYVKALGVNLDDVFIAQPATGDDALALAKVMAEAGVGLIVVDDVPSMVSKAELEKEITDSNIGLQARMMSQGLRQLQPIIRRNNTAIIFINQIREKIGVMYGNPETTPGGRALKFFASMRIEMRATSKRDDEGTRTNVKIVKNKLAPPYKTAEIRIVYSKGIDGADEAFGIAVEMNIIQKKGGWYVLPRLDCAGIIALDPDLLLRFQGEDNTKVFIGQTDGYFDALTQAIAAQANAPVPEHVEALLGDRQ